MMSISVIVLPVKIYAQTLETLGNQSNTVEEPQIKLDHPVFHLAINNDTNKIYVSNRALHSDVITVIDGDSGNETDIRVGKFPISIAVNPVTNEIYVSHALLNDIITVIDGNTDKNLTNIHVEKFPISIAVNPVTNEIYVSQRNGNITLINGYVNKINMNIHVEKFPSSIAVNPTKNTIYVADIGSDSVTVIDGYTNKIETNIHVGKFPSSIAVNPVTNEIYVANFGSDSVTVIDGYTNKIETNIHVGKFPSSIAVNPTKNTIYVANTGADSVTVIDGYTNKAAAGVTFNIIPSDSGHIICNKNIESPNNQYFYVGFETECTAQPNKGFEFLDWVENLGHNSSTIIKLHTVSNSLLDSFLDILGFKPNDPAATLYVTKFGSFTAHFKAIPPAIPAQYWIPLYGVIVSSIVGWSTPNIIGAMKSKKQRRIHVQYQNEINSVYDDSKSYKDNIKKLHNLNDRIRHSHIQGKISDQQYEGLKNETSILYQEILKNKMDSLNKEIINSDNMRILDDIKNEITELYAKGKITLTHYDLLNKKISYYENHKISKQ
jgi:YVTN family beta-propeller protein